MRSLLAFRVEGFHDAPAVARINTQQSKDHKANSPAFFGRARFEGAPEIVIDIAQAVLRHATSLRHAFCFTSDRAAVIWRSCGGLGGIVRAA